MFQVFSQVLKCVMQEIKLRLSPCSFAADYNVYVMLKGSNTSHQLMKTFDSVYKQGYLLPPIPLYNRAVD